MNLFTRISATLNATASHTAARFENHRAIGQAAIERAREAVAAARATERRHQRQGDALDKRRTDTRAAIDTWSRRAREAGDDATALHCLQRRHDERERLATLDQALQAHTASTSRLSEHVRELEHALEAMTGRYDALASRETLARADRAVACRDDGRLDEVFERWETRVDITEMAAPGAAGHERTAYDDTDDRYAEQERHQRLADELQALRAGTEDAR